MAELKGKKRKQPSSCPEGWAPGAIVVQLELTRRQEHHARRCVGISRFVYNRLVANDQAGRAVDLWLTPHELEKEFNAAKRVNIRPWPSSPRSASSWPRARAAATGTPVPAG